MFNPRSARTCTRAAHVLFAALATFPSLANADRDRGSETYIAESRRERREMDSEVTEMDDRIRELEEEAERIRRGTRSSEFRGDCDRACRPTTGASCTEAVYLRLGFAREEVDGLKFQTES